MYPLDIPIRSWDSQLGIPQHPPRPRHPRLGWGLFHFRNLHHRRALPTKRNALRCAMCDTVQEMWMVWSNACVYIYIYVYVYMYMYICMCIYIYMCTINICIINTYSYIVFNAIVINDTYIHSYIHTYLYICIEICMYVMCMNNVCMLSCKKKIAACLGSLDLVYVIYTYWYLQINVYIYIYIYICNVCMHVYIYIL